MPRFSGGTSRLKPGVQLILVTPSRLSRNALPAHLSCEPGDLHPQAGLGDKFANSIFQSASHLRPKDISKDISMKHAFIDKYSNLDSFIHRLDPRTRILVTLVFVLAVMATPPTAWRAFVLYTILITSLIILARLPPLYVLKRSAVIMPFVLMIAIFIPFLGRGEVAGSYNVWLWQVSVTYDGLLVLWNVLVKAWLSTLGLILLSATTPFPRLLKGLEQLGVPRVLVMILAFMYRYIFVLTDEVLRMQRAMESRSVAPLRARRGRRLWPIRTVGNIIGTLFIRSYERGERVYGAMLARGFDGEIRTLSDLRFGRADLGFGVAFSLALAAIGLVAIQ